MTTRVAAGGVFLLLGAGALVTSTESGLAVPDWPLSYGQVMPPMVGGILYEHGHRLVAAAVSTLVGLQLAIVWIFDRRRSLRLLAALAFGAILLQAVLGGLTVLLLLPPAVSSAHAGLAQIVFALTASMALLTWPGMEDGGAFRVTGADGPELDAAFRLTSLATAIIFLQIVLGAVMRHTGAGLAIPDFPGAFGGLVPGFSDLARRGVPIHLAHRLGALAVALAVAAAAGRLRRLERVSPALRTLGGAWALIVIAQLMLGGFSIWTRKAVPVTVAHLETGALCWVTGVLACVSLAVARRRLAPAPSRAPASTPALSARPA